MAKNCFCTGRIAQEPKDIKGGINVCIITPNEEENSNGEYDSTFVNIPLYGPYAQKMKNVLHKGDVVDARWIEIIDKTPYTTQTEKEGKIIVKERPNVRIRDAHIWKHSSSNKVAKETNNVEENTELETVNVAETSQEVPVENNKQPEPVKETPASDKNEGRAKGEW